MKNRNTINKILSFVLLTAMILALCACGTAAEPEATPTPTSTPAPTPTPEPTPEPDPETVDAVVKTAELKMVYTTLNRGDIVNVTGESEDGQYAILTDADGNEFYAFKAYLRTEDDEPFAGERQGYAVANAKMYSTAFLEGEPLTTLAQNSELQVLDELNGIVYCSYQPTGEDAEPIIGYLSSEDVKSEQIQVYWGYYDYGGGGGGGGDSGGGASYSDGADIVLGYRSDDRPVISLLAAESVSGKEATVFTDGLELYAGIAAKGDTVQLIAKDNDEEWTVLVNHLVCTIPAKSVRVVGEDEPFEEFTGWVAEGGGKIYDNPELKGDAIEFTVNVQLKVMDQIGDVYYVEVTENSVKQCGMTGYIKVEEVSDSITVIQYGGWGDYGGGGGGDSGGGAEWSGDVM